MTFQVLEKYCMLIWKDLKILKVYRNVDVILRDAVQITYSPQNDNVLDLQIQSDITFIECYVTLRSNNSIDPSSKCDAWDIAKYYRMTS